MKKRQQLKCPLFIVIVMDIACVLFLECYLGQKHAYSAESPKSATSPTAGRIVQPLFTDLSEDEKQALGFIPIPSAANARPGEDPRIARLDWNLLSDALRETANVCLSLASPQDCREFFPVKPSGTLPSFNGPQGTIPRRSWVGRLSGDASSEAVLIIRAGDQVISGTVRFQGRIYEINPVGRAVISIVDVNPRLYVPDKSPPRNPVIPQADNPALQNPIPRRIQTGQKTKIDVMVVYTPAARAKVEASCSLCLITDNITAAVEQANRSLTTTQQELRLVYVNEVNYSRHNSVAEDKSYLQSKGDGFLDEVHQWRCDSKADLVSLWVEYDPPEPCGEAYSTMKYISPGTWGNNYTNPEQWAFSVVRQNCAANFLTFHHELGHVMGADHDRSDVVKRMGGSLNGYGYGYADWDGQKATIMAVPSNSGWFENLWSSPSQEFSIGSLAGTSLDDNRRVLNETAAKVSSFSDSICPDSTAPAAPQNLRTQ